MPSTQPASRRGVWPFDPHAPSPNGCRRISLHLTRDEYALVERIAMYLDRQLRTSMDSNKRAVVASLKLAAQHLDSKKGAALVPLAGLKGVTDQERRAFAERLRRDPPRPPPKPVMSPADERELILRLREQSAATADPP
jgi:hypothetical protein